MKGRGDIHPNSAQNRARCQGDGCLKRGGGVLLRVRLNPRNLRPEHERLCDRCARAGGWARAYSPTAATATVNT